MYFFLVVYIRSVKGKDKRTELMSFSGQFTLSIDRAKQGTCYKYVVIEKGDVHCEYLAEFPPRNKGEIINRFLSIPDKYLKPGGELLLCFKVIIIHFILFVLYFVILLTII